MFVKLGCLVICDWSLHTKFDRHWWLNARTKQWLADNQLGYKRMLSQKFKHHFYSFHYEFFIFLLHFFVLHANRQILYDDFIVMSRTKTNRRTDRQQYTRSNPATARLLTFVNLAETLAPDWPNTNKRLEMVTSTITLLSKKNQIDWDSATCITNATDYYQRLTLLSWLTTLQQTPLNCSRQLLALYNYLFTESSKSNYERTTGQLTSWLTINDCLTVTIDGSKCTNDTSQLNWQTTNNIAT